MKMKNESEVTQSCPTLSDPMDCSLPCSSIYGILQARVLEWGAIAFSKSYLYEAVKNTELLFNGSIFISIKYARSLGFVALTGLRENKDNWKKKIRKSSS